MPRVTLEFAVDDKGSAVVRQIVSETEKSLGGLKTAAVEAGQGAGKLRESIQATGAPAQALKDAITGLGSEGASVFGRLSGLITSLGPIGIGLGAAAFGATRALGAFQDLAEQTRDLTLLSGGSAREVSGLLDVMDDLGISSETLVMIMNRMSQAVATQDPALARLGISARSASGEIKSGLQVFYETIDALRTTTDETDRNRLAQEILGRSWTRMLPAIEQGADALRKAAAASGKLMSEEDIQRGREYRAILAEIGDIWEGLVIKLARGVHVPITMSLTGATGAYSAENRLAADQLRTAMNPATVQGYWKQWREQNPNALVDISLKTGLWDILQYYRSQLPEKTYSDVGAWRQGTPGALVSPGGMPPVPGEKPAEMEQRLKYEQQLAQLRVAAAQAGATTDEARLQAARDEVRAIRDQIAAQLDLQAIQTQRPEDLSRIGALRVQLTETTNARLGALQTEYNEKVARKGLTQEEEDLASSREAWAAYYKYLEDVRAKAADELAKYVDTVTGELAAELEWTDKLIPEAWAAYSQYLKDTSPEGQIRRQEETLSSDRSRTRASAALALGGAAFLPVVDWQQSLDLIGREVDTLGAQHFDGLTEQINVTRQALIALLSRPPDERNQVAQQIDELKAKFLDLSQTQELREGFHSLFAGVEDSITTSINGVIQGTQTLGGAWRNMLVSMALGVENYLIRGALTDLENALGRMAMGSSWTNQSGGLGWLGKLVGGLFSGWGGGGVTSGAFAEGGVLTEPVIGVGRSGRTYTFAERGPEEFGGVATVRRGGGGGGTVNQYITINAGVPEEVRRQINAARPQLRADAVEAMVQASNRGGIVSQSVGRRTR